MEQKIKQDSIHIGENIRRERLQKGIGQTELVRQLQLAGVDVPYIRMICKNLVLLLI